MARILVIGSCGAGKSTLSFALAKVMGLPLFHLDRVARLTSPKEVRVFLEQAGAIGA